MNIPIVAETITHLGPLPVTNALVNSTIVMVLFVIASFVLKVSIKKVPGKLQAGMEMLLEFLLKTFDGVTQDRAKSRRFLPLVGTMFLFILASNWFGLFPGTGSIGVWQMHNGEVELIPILRSAASDLNLTIALALISVVTSHVMGMFALGFFVHWNKFIPLGTLWKALKTLNPVKVLVALVEMLVGVIELFAEIAKVMSLSLRLFGNIFAGEVLMTVISSLVAFFVPLPFMFLELIVGVVQATVFSMLTLVYLTLMTSAPHGEHDEKHGEGHGHADPVMENAKAQVTAP